MKSLIVLSVVALILATTGLIAQPAKHWVKVGKEDTLLFQPLNLNSAGNDYAPILIPNGKMYFTSDRRNQYGDEMELSQNENIYEAVREGHSWFISQVKYYLNNDDQTAIAGLSNDGLQLFTYKSFNNGDLYQSDNKNNFWTKPMKMQINSEDHEQSIAEYNGMIIFSSDRVGGLGEHDLYWQNGVDGESQSLIEINTAYEEVDVSLSSDGKKLYFSSNRNDKYEIFVSKFIKDEWQKPELLSKPINCSSNSRWFRDCDSLFFLSSDRLDGAGGYDLYWGYIIPKEKTIPIKIEKKDTLVSKIEPIKTEIQTLAVLNDRPERPIFFGDSAKDSRFLKIFPILDSMGFKVRYAYVQVAAFHYKKTVPEFKAAFPSFSDTPITVEKVWDKKANTFLYKFMVDTKFQTLKEAALIQQEAVTEHKIRDAFIAVYNEKGQRIVIYFDIYTPVCTILVDGVTLINF